MITLDLLESAQKKWGEPRDISNLVCFLLSDKSSYITGSSFNVDGGWLNS